MPKPLEAVLTDKTNIPTGLEDYYVEADGQFVLNVPGMKTQSDFDAYAAALKARFTDAGADFSRKNHAGLNREDVAEIIEGALSKLAPAAKKGKQGDTDKGDGQATDDTVTARLHDLERNVASLTADNKNLKEERDTALSQGKATTIRNELQAAASKAGAAPEGVANLVTLIQPHFEVTQDGSVVTKLDAGAGVSPNQKPDDYLATIARDKQFRMFWGASVGAGADSSTGPAGSGTPDKANPWTKAGWNITEQGHQFRADKANAEALMKAAGVELGAIAPVR